MHHEATYCLAKTEHGRVNVCACGCTQLMFGRVTLHFETEAAFAEMADAIIEEAQARTPDEEFELRYDWYSMSLSPYGSAQLARLVREATEALAWLRGELKFTDEDFRKLTG